MLQQRRKHFRRNIVGEAAFDKCLQMLCNIFRAEIVELQVLLSPVIRQLRKKLRRGTGKEPANYIVEAIRVSQTVVYAFNQLANILNVYGFFAAQPVSA